jgi:hypothetical protein
MPTSCNAHACGAGKGHRIDDGPRFSLFQGIAQSLRDLLMDSSLLNNQTAFCRAIARVANDILAGSAAALIPFFAFALPTIYRHNPKPKP